MKPLLRSLGKKFFLRNSRRQIDWKALLHLSIKLCVNQNLNQINSSLSTLFSLWNTIIESYYTRKAQIYTKYWQHLPSITSAMAAGSKSRWSHVTFMARNERHSRSKTFSQLSHQWFFISSLPSNFSTIQPLNNYSLVGSAIYSLDNWLSMRKVNKIYLLFALAQS